MIRKSRKEDIDKLVEIWFEVSLKAHDFIGEGYWQAAQEDMREKYLPMSDTYVVEGKNEIRGFVSMLDNYLAAIFIDSRFQSQGYGKKLMDFVKKDRDYIELKVFKKNNKACDFYINNGFKIKDELTDENTNEKEYLMVWKCIE
ncbi:N-acetyltransferase [Iocasia frigidifontis]|uniref:N-acetyltransferase n=1 Tax=Iocasia fonsfrigidae TaxID=2682810 RepID=A0A8A7KB15_9FIRM|nr:MULTISPECIES: N-acetyltransferase [Halanaerobiaceae]AZO95777.1 N-acetyltransferase [Halocella sp. SP3-1]QTL98641.1 N-acetyltransferase [Iocasia fonsfrigidae]